MTELLRSDLIQLYNLLVMKLTDKDISWLKQNRPVKWGEIDFNDRQIYINPSGNVPYVKEINNERDYMWRADISFKIQDMIDAINNKEELTYSVNLTRPMMLALMAIFNVQDKPHANKFEIFGAIKEFGKKI